MQAQYKHSALSISGMALEPMAGVMSLITEARHAQVQELILVWHTDFPYLLLAFLAAEDAARLAANALDKLSC